MTITAERRTGSATTVPTGDQHRRPVVLVGVDGSTSSGRALDWAVREAAARSAVLRVVHVVHTSGSPFLDANPLPDDDVAGRGGCVVDAAIDRADRVDPSVPVEGVLRSGPPSEALLDAARDADLVVVGTRGLGLVGAVLLSSVGSRLASRAAAPIVVVPPVDHCRARTTDVVVGVDGSVDADAALRVALDEAATTGGRVVAVNAWRLRGRSSHDRDPWARADAERAAHDAAAATVRAALARVRRPAHDDVTVDVFVVDRDPSAALLEAGRVAALTVVGTRGRGDEEGSLLGSVTEAVLHRATGPVAVVHAAA
ncbi:universal stress protein [Cellulosimicrobium terreum]|nr:universal stress protein [Cellulosimicrobium terreum]